MSGTAIVFLTHAWTPAVARRFERLWRETSSFADCYLLLQDDDAEVLSLWQSTLQDFGATGAMFRFSSATLPTQLGLRYFGLRDVLSNAHFPLMLFARAHPHTHYWQVEHDVEYRGPWHEFFDAYRDSDSALLAAHFHKWADWPEWMWWPSITTPQQVKVPADSLYKAFMPVVRLSQRALQDVEQAHRQGWMGHFEALVPTVLLMNGHKLEDLNVRRPCYIGGFQDPIPLLPLLSTLRCRPPVDIGEFCNRGQGALLFHPVKDAWTFDGKEVKLIQ